jgi:hypothetical protein
MPRDKQGSIYLKKGAFETTFILNSRLNPNTWHNMSCNSHDLISWTAAQEIFLVGVTLSCCGSHCSATTPV